jgi:hypothetical protein
MSGVLSRLGSVFVAPVAAAASAEAAVERARASSLSQAAPLRVAVLCRAQDAAAVGGAVGLAAARARGVSHAVVCVWGSLGGGSLSSPAVPAAVRLGERLGARGHVARATGRLVVVVGGDAGEVRRIPAAAGAAPVVLVCAGARDAAVDAVLAEQDLVVVAAADGSGALVDAALDGLAVLGVPARALALPAGGAPARAFAAAGIALLPPLRAVAEAAVEVER